jgi:protein O-GlcNAc transferase
MDDDVKKLLARQDWAGLLAWANKALLIGESLPEAWKIKGFSLAALGKDSEAISSLKKADENMDDPDVTTNLGVLLHNAKQYNEAEGYYKRAIALSPNVARMHSNLAELCMDIRDYRRAAQAYGVALKLSPTDTDTIYNLGICHWKDKKLSLALELFARSLQLQESPRVRVSRGEIYRDLGQFDLAQRDFELALDQEPENISALLGMVNIKLDQRDYSSALNSALHLERSQPLNYMVAAILAEAYKKLGFYAKALKYCTQAIHLNPNNLLLKNNLANVTLEMGDHLAAEDILKRVIASDEKFFEAYSNLIYCIHLRSKHLTDEDFSTILGYEKALESLQIRSNNRRFPKSSGIQRKKIKLGFVTGDFRSHPVGYFSEAFLGELKSRDYVMVGFPTNPLADQVTQKLKTYLEDWVPIYEMDDQCACEVIREKNIDILFDLSGHTAHNRLGIFFLRPAPVQVTYLGYFGTTGLRAIDYIIASKKTIKKDEFSSFTESPLLLDCSHLVYRPPVLVPIDPEPPLERNGYITYGVFNRLSKINNDVLSVWAGILHKTQTSKIIFVGKGFNDREFVSDLSARLILLGANDSQMEFFGHMSLNQYFEIFNSVDVCLDTFPFPGGTTTLDSLMMGVPVITKAGDSFIGRQGEMILETLGLNEWVAKDNPDYIRLSSHLANKIGLLKKLRSTLRDRVMQSELYNSSKLGYELDRHLRNVLTLSINKNNGEGR